MKRKANRLVKKMKQKELTLALAESITCGLAAMKLSSCVGVSDVLTASVVCYTPKAKMELLEVEKSIIERCTCESPEVTQQMAQHLSKRIKADVYAAITGLASPDGSETKEKPVGSVFYAVCYQNKTYNFRQVFHGSPLEIKTKAAVKLYDFILDVIGK